MRIKKYVKAILFFFQNPKIDGRRIRKTNNKKNMALSIDLKYDIIQLWQITPLELLYDSKILIMNISSLVKD